MTSCANVTHDSTTDLPTVQVWDVIAGLGLFFLTLPFLLFHSRAVPLGTTIAALIGALLMIITRVVPQDDAYDVIAREQYARCLLLLLAVMIFAYYWNRERIFTCLIRRLLQPTYSFKNYIWRIVIIVALFSALFTSEAMCLILTPIILKQWESHERCRKELHTIILAITTSANIGSVLMIFGSAHVMLISSTTLLEPYSKSRLDLKTCLLYLGPCVILTLLLNILFLILHYKLRSLGNHKMKLMSDAAHSDQEMTNLTSVNGTKTIENGHVYYLNENSTSTDNQDDNTRHDVTGDDGDDAAGGAGGYRDVNTPPCALETIMEDEILEIISDGPSGRSLTSLRALSGADVSCDLSTIDKTLSDNKYDSDEDIITTDASTNQIEDDNEEDIRISREQSSEHLSNCDVTYEPTALSRHQSDGREINQSQSCIQNDTNALNKHGLLLSKTYGIYRSFGGISAVNFLSTEFNSKPEVELGQGYSKLFPVICTVLPIAMIPILLMPNIVKHVDMGWVAIATATVIITADAVLNKRHAMTTLQQLDWSIVIKLYAVFIWMHGFQQSTAIRWIWTELGLIDSHYDNFSSVAFLCVVVLIGTNFSSSFIMSIMILTLLIPCQDQLILVLLVTWTSGIAGNLTLFGSVSNFIVIQKAQELTDYRMLFWTHFQFGFVTTLVYFPAGIFILLGLVRITS